MAFNLLFLLKGARILATNSSMCVLTQQFKNAKVFRWLEVVLEFVTGNGDRMIYVEHVPVWLRSWSEIELSQIHFRIKSTVCLSLKTHVWMMTDA